MKVLIALACTAGAVVLLSEQMRRFPAVFYGVAALLDGFLLYAYSYPMPAFVWGWLLKYVQRCLFGQALLVIVMFIGVLGDGSRLKARLLPIRGELSITAAILVIGHAVPHLPFLARVLGNLGAVPTGRAVSFLCPRCCSRSSLS